MPIEPLIVDSGPLVALLAEKDQHHRWAAEYLGNVELPLLTCEAVLSEVFYHLRKDAVGLERLVEMIEGEVFQVVPVVHPATVSRYALSNRVDFADACIALLSERFPRSRVVTVDRRDFSRLLRFGAEPIPFDSP